VQAIASDRMAVHVIAPPERKYSSWIGGYILASLSSFDQMWYRECIQKNVSLIVHRKCF
jgi:actin-related protein